MFHYRTPAQSLVHIPLVVDPDRSLCGLDISSEAWTDKDVDCPRCLAARNQRNARRRALDVLNYLDAAHYALKDVYKLRGLDRPGYTMRSIATAQAWARNLVKNLSA